MSIHNNEHSEDFSIVIVSNKSFYQMLVLTTEWTMSFSIYFDRLNVINGAKLSQDIERI